MFTFKIEPDGGEAFTVKADSRDISRWERTNKGASLHQLREELRVIDLYKIAFNAATRQGLWSDTQANFESDCAIDTINDDEDDESADPTPSAA